MNVQWPVASGAIGAIVLVAYLLLRLLRQENRATRIFWVMADYELKVAKRENRVCSRRLGMLVDIIREHGIPVSNDIWTVPEKEEPDIPRPDGLI